jgi:predicted nucleotidyltransferase
VRDWADQALINHHEILGLGYFGSYARGDWGVGSDLDLIVIVTDSKLPFNQRAIEWDVTSLPVSTDILVYTLEEWQALESERFKKVILADTVWVIESELLHKHLNPA